MDENIKAMYQGYFESFNAVPAKDPELQKKIDDWKQRVEAFAATLSNMLDFYPKYMESGLNEEYTTLVTQLYTQPADNTSAAGNNDKDVACNGSTEKPTITVRDFLEQYRTPYNEVCNAGYRKRTEKAYENIFAVANRTDDMLEAQIIMERERLLWNIVSEDWNDIYEPILEAIDPLLNPVYLPNKRIYETYRACNCDEEMTYHGQRLERQTNIIKQRELVPTQFALQIAYLAGEAAGKRNEFWTNYLKNDMKNARRAAVKSLVARDKCRRMIQLLKESYNMTFNDMAARKHLRPFMLAAANLVELGRYKKSLPPAQLEYYSEIVNKQIIPDLTDEEFLCYETHSTGYKLYEAADYDQKIKHIADENSMNLTYYKYKEQLSKKINN